MSTEVIFIGLSLAALEFLVGVWIEARLTKSISHEYDKKLECYKYEIGRREKAAKISEMFSQWIKYRGNESGLLEKEKLREYYTLLNQMSFELTLWIEDPVLLEKIMSLLRLEPGSITLQEALLEIRKVLLDKTETDFVATDITIWPKELGSLYKN